MDYREALDYLNLTENYSDEELKNHYKLLAKRYHPDNALNADEDMFITIKEAFELLSSRSRDKNIYKQSENEYTNQKSVCPMCSGTGQRREKIKTARGFMATKVVCKYCNGTGQK